MQNLYFRLTSKVNISKELVITILKNGFSNLYQCDTNI